MQDIRNHLNDRIRDIDVLEELLSFLENSNNFNHGIDSVKTSPVIKSTILLALYNMIEFTATSLLKEIHNTINNRNLNIYDLKEPIRKLYLIYTLKAYEKKNDIHSVLNIISTSVDTILSKKTFNLSFDEMIKHYSLYSGNLDARKIRSIFKKYEIDIPEKIRENNIDIKLGENLNKIMKIRNKLAHGEISFEEQGRMSIVDIKKYIEEVKKFLYFTIDEIESFIDNELYLENK